MAITREERELIKAELKEEMRREMEGRIEDAFFNRTTPSFDLSVRNALRGREEIFTGSLIERYITFQKGTSDFYIPPSKELEGACIFGFRVVDPARANTFSPISLTLDSLTGEFSIKLNQVVQDNTSCIISFRK